MEQTVTVIHLSDAHASVLIDTETHALPAVLHWGRALGDLGDEDLAHIAPAVSRQTPPGTLDAVTHPTLLPQEADAFTGRPGLQLRLDGAAWAPRWTLVEQSATATTARFVADADAAGLRLTTTIALDGGVVWIRHALSRRSDATGALEVEACEATMPVPTTVDRLTTFDGRWTREKRPVTGAIAPGSSARQSRRGRGGHDAPHALLLSEGEPRWRDGSVWGVHLAWPSDATYRVDRLTDAPTLIGAGELLRSGELPLGPGEEYVAPAAAFVFSPDGLDGFAARVHAWMRSRDQHPRGPRPLTLNTWEAVYFDHDPARITELAELAAELGVERFVLDDGWFLGRRDDTTSLGDWIVDESVWPDGLRPLADRVHELGMQFGLWFEPEMVSLDSDLARAHPDWLLHDPRHLDHDPALSWRSQFVLDLANPGAFQHVLGQMDALVTELGIDAIKWDHNRDLVESVSAGRPGSHRPTIATLELMAELKRRHPGLEIESCSSGGGRTDLGVLEVCDRVWASDSNDPIERLDIQRWTGLLLPPELVGAHVGPTRAHSSGRVTSLALRMATSLTGSAGFEWNLLDCDDDERARITAFAALYKELRPTTHGGVVVHPPLRDEAWRATGFVGPDAGEAAYVVATVRSLEDARPERLRLVGLDPDRRYRVRVRREIGPAAHGWVTPPWFERGEIVLRGSVLERVGLQLPTLWPGQAFILHAVPDGE